MGELIAGTMKRLTVSISSAKPINRLSFVIKLKINLKEEEEVKTRVVNKKERKRELHIILLITNWSFISRPSSRTQRTISLLICD